MQIDDLYVHECKQWFVQGYISSIQLGRPCK